MTSLRAPGLGPIVGHTTDTTCRVWIRAGDPGDASVSLDENRRTVGVIGFVSRGKIGEAWYFRLNREYDRTGTFQLGSDRQLGWYPDDFAEQNKPEPVRLPKGTVSAPLQPDTEYSIRVGTLTIDDPAPNAERTPDWMLRDRLPAACSARSGERTEARALVREAGYRSARVPSGPWATPCTTTWSFPRSFAR